MSARRAAFPLLLLVAGFSSAVDAAPLAGEPYGFGLGIVAGDPTGLSMIYRTDDVSAFQVALGWNTYRDSVHLNLDYLYNVAILEGSNASVRFPFYVGIGARICVSDDDDWDWGDDWDDDCDSDWGYDDDDEGIGVRIPLGIALLPPRAPLDLFFELAPAVNLIPEPDPALDGGIGARFYF